MKTKLHYKKHLKSIILLLFFTGISLFSFSQENQNKEKRGEKIKKLKVAYFTEELNLTVAESEKFWPIYNEMEEKLKTNRKDNKKVIDEISKNVDTYTDEDYKKSVNKIFENDINQTTIKKDYYAKIAAVIGYKKATKLLKLEKEFKQKLLKELKKRRNENQNPPGEKK